MSQSSRYHLFQCYGVELEYMLVDRDTLQVRPIADELLHKVLGSYGSDFENGMVTWSNELVTHVIEIKSTRPESNLSSLETAFAANITQINNLLSSLNVMLMPGAAHPLMDPLQETRLWPHDNNEVYEIYNRIFDCRGHGWSNLQSTHLNLPFYDDEEFARLHAAVRIILPLLPALCASSPILDGKVTGTLDTRLKYYKTNQARIPSITGKVIPEAIFSKRNYLNSVYEKIKADIKPFDPGNELNPIWVNSRGAIPRFDRGSIEIRIMDIQECPVADLAIVTLVIETLRTLVDERMMSFDAQMHWRTDALAEIFEGTIQHGQHYRIHNSDYLAAFGLSREVNAGELWSHIVERLLRMGCNAMNTWQQEIQTILREGNLASRILKAVGQEARTEDILSAYRLLCRCLEQNKMFIP